MRPFEADLDRVAARISALGFSDQQFFITGATGLVGSMLVKALLTANRLYGCGNTVTALVRDPEKARRMLSAYAGGDDLRFFVGDVTSPVAFEGEVDYVIHAASETKSVNMVNYPVETLWTSVCWSRNLLELAREKNVSGMVYLSSMEAFGRTDPALERVAEKDIGFIDLMSVRSCYPESKRLVENLCVCYAKEYGLPVVSARLAQTFGAGVSKTETRVFAQFARSAIEKKDIVLHTKGMSVGNYVYTADAAEAIFLLLKQGAPGETYTVANEATSIRIRDMAQMVADRLANGEIRVVFDIPEQNTFGYAPDVEMRLSSKKLQALGWTPQVDLEEAYRRLIADWEEAEE